MELVPGFYAMDGVYAKNVSTAWMQEVERSRKPEPRNIFLPIPPASTKIKIPQWFYRWGIFIFTG